MIIIQWNEHMQTGIDIIDSQHRGLVDQLNLTAPLLAIRGDTPVEDLDVLHEWLTQYADTHFSTEEDFMRRYRVDDRVTSAHRASHKDFVRHLHALTDRRKRNEAVTGNDLLAFLAGWLVSHILGEDQTLARQIHAVESGLTPDVAYRQAGGYRTTPSNEAINAILIDLYGQMCRAQARLERADALPPRAG